jgi:hypothetical protein
VVGAGGGWAPDTWARRRAMFRELPRPLRSHTCVTTGEAIEKPSAPSITRAMVTVFFPPREGEPPAQQGRHRHHGMRGKGEKAVQGTAVRARTHQEDRAHSGQAQPYLPHPRAPALAVVTQASR